MKNERLHQRLNTAKVEFFAWINGDRDKPPVNPFLPPEVEEGLYMPDGLGTEIELFTAPKSVTEIWNEDPNEDIKNEPTTQGHAY